jgi:hypothetical protein
MQIDVLQRENSFSNAWIIRRSDPIARPGRLETRARRAVFQATFMEKVDEAGDQPATTIWRALIVEPEPEPTTETEWPIRDESIPCAAGPMTFVPVVYLTVYVLVLPDDSTETVIVFLLIAVTVPLMLLARPRCRASAALPTPRTTAKTDTMIPRFMFDSDNK